MNATSGTLNEETHPQSPLAPPSGRSGAILAAVLLLASAVVLWLHARQLQFFCDDSYISYRYSENFAAGHGLVYNLGERVEGYTNFLWVVALGMARKCGANLEAASLWLGVFCLLVTLWATASEGRRLIGGWIYALVAVVLLVCQGPLILWSVSGLESSCFAAATMLALLVYHRGMQSPRGLLLAGVLYGLSCMVRPDGVVFGAAAGLHLLLRGLLSRPLAVRKLMTHAASLAGGFFAVFGPFVLWRHSYYDDWLPNTFYVKTGGLVNVELGLQYLATYSREYPLVVVLTLLGAVTACCLPAWRAQRPAFTHILLALTLFTAYILWAGGDYMALYRFIAPLLPLALLLVLPLLITLYRSLLERVLPKSAAVAIALLAVAASGWWCWQPTRKSLDGVEAMKTLATVKRMKRNSKQWTLIGEVAHRAFPADWTLATTAAGALPYFAGQRTIDQSGLCDRHTAKVASDPWMLDRPGHMKQSTREYLGERRPEVIFWHPQIGPAEFPPSITAPTPDYEMRAMLVPGLEEEGLALFFWVRRDVAKDVAPSVDGHGVVSVAQAARLINLIKKRPANGNDEGK